VCSGCRTLTAGTVLLGPLTRLTSVSFKSVCAFLSFFLYSATASVLCWRYGPKLGRLYTHTHTHTHTIIYKRSSNTHPELLVVSGGTFPTRSSSRGTGFPFWCLSVGGDWPSQSFSSRLFRYNKAFRPEHTHSSRYHHAIITVSSRYHHAIITLSSRYHHGIITVSSRYHHAIITLSSWVKYPKSQALGLVGPSWGWGSGEHTKCVCRTL